MKLFQDRYNTRSETELYLLLADCLWVAWVLMFCSGCWTAPNSFLVAASLAVWAVVPRCLAPSMRWLGESKAFVSSLLIAGSVTAIIGVLTVVGADLVLNSAAEMSRPSMLLSVLLFAGWLASFFLFTSAGYIVVDVLLFLCVIVAVSSGQPHAWWGISGTLILYCFSAAIRNVLYGIYRDVRRPAINLQNAAMIGALASTGGVLYFLVLGLIFGSAMSAPEPEQSLEQRETKDNGALLSGDVTAPLPRSVIGYSPSVSLENLNRVGVNSDRLLLVRYSQASDRARWRAHSGMLWCLQRYSTPSAGGDLWQTGELGAQRQWPLLDNDSVAWLWADLKAQQSSTPSIEFEVEVLDSSLKTLLSPTSIRSYRFRRVGGAQYQRSDTGDVHLNPGLKSGERYRFRFVPIALNPQSLIIRLRQPLGKHDDPVYSYVPKSEEFGFDLDSLAWALFDGSTTISSHIDRLRAFYAQNFEYSLLADWRTGEHRLRHFMLKEKKGDCNYFASSAALLLRAGGLSTRVCGGIAGGDWNFSTQAYELRNSTAHAWFEVYVPNFGWLPLDASQWADLDLTQAQLPSLISNSGRDLARNLNPLAGSNSTAPGSSSAQPPANDAPVGAGNEPAGGVAANDGNRGQGGAGSSSGRPGNQGAVGQSRGATAGSSTTGESATGRWPATGAAAVGEFENRRSQDSTLAAVDSTTLQGDWQVEHLLARGKARRRLSEQMEPDVAESIKPTSAQRTANLRTDASADPNYSVTPARSSSATKTKVWRPFALLLVSSLCALGAVWWHRKKERERRQQEDKEEGEEPELAFADPLKVLEQALPKQLPQALDEQVLYAYQKLQKDLSYKRTHRVLGETPLEHMVRLSSPGTPLEAAFELLVSRLYGVLFGRLQPNHQDLELVKQSCDWIRQELG